MVEFLRFLKETHYNKTYYGFYYICIDRINIYKGYMSKLNFYFLILFYFLSSTITIAADKSALLNKASEKVSGALQNMIPGEGDTEDSDEVSDADKDEINFSILGVRDLSSTDRSNFFTQFSLANQETSGDQRIIGNLGFGYRTLSRDENMMFGVNTFYDRDFMEEHDRFGFGVETSAFFLDMNLNNYYAISDALVVDGVKEETLTGFDYNITSQIPRAPWARFNYNGYKWEAKKATSDLKGSVYSLELDLTRSIEFVTAVDKSSLTGVDDEITAKVNYIYPPRNKIAMTDGFSSDFFEKGSVKQKLKEKVRRHNKLVMEIQGAIILTSK